VANEEEKTFVPNFWDRPQEAQKLMQAINDEKQWVKSFDFAKQMVEDLNVLFEFFEEGDVSGDEIKEKYTEALELIEDLEFKNMLSEESDPLTAILQITAGAGGTESCDWAEMLMRMYIMWADRRNFKIRELNHQGGDVAGIKNRYSRN